MSACGPWGARLGQRAPRLRPTLSALVAALVLKVVIAQMKGD